MLLKKNSQIIGILLLAVSSVFSQNVFVDDSWGSLNPGTIVPGGHVIGQDAFATINEALTSLKDTTKYPTVNVLEGKYHELFTIINPLWLKGAGVEKCTLDNIDYQNGVIIRANNVKVSGFSIIGDPKENNSYGIDLIYYDSSIIEDNNIADFSVGIRIHGSKNNRIKRNSIFNNGDGVTIRSSVCDSLTGNRIVENSDNGIFSEQTSYFDSNWICNNGSSGIRTNVLGRGRITRNRISNNGGSGIEGPLNDILIAGNLFSGNALNGIDIFSHSFRCTTYNNTVVKNHSHGIYLRDSYSDLVVENCIIAYNDSFGIIAGSTTKLENNHNNIFSNKAGNYQGRAYKGIGDISIDPQFIDDMQDYRLQSSSPCVGAGILQSSYLYDLNGIPFPSPKCSHPDMGAFEFDSAYPFGSCVLYTAIQDIKFGSIVTGSSVSYNTAIKYFGLSPKPEIKFTLKNDAFSVKQISGSLNACDSLIISISFTPTDSTIYEDTLIIGIAQSCTNFLAIPLNGIGDTSSLIPSEYYHDFGNTVPGSSKTWQLSIKNKSDTDSQIIDIYASSYSLPNVFNVSKSNDTIVPNGSVLLNISYNPKSIGVDSGYIAITNQANNRIEIWLKGKGAVQAAIQKNSENNSMHFSTMNIDSKGIINYHAKHQTSLKVEYFTLQGKKIGSTETFSIPKGEGHIKTSYSSKFFGQAFYIMTIQSESGEKQCKILHDLGNNIQTMQ
jgi:parallel beta-helix repeat protein